MDKKKLQKFSLQTIADAVAHHSETNSARSALAFAVGSFLDVAGKVLKRVKREGQCKLLIQPGDVPGFVVFADCLSDAKAVEARKIRKGSDVVLRGRLLCFGWSAICLKDSRLRKHHKNKQKQEFLPI